MKIEENEIKEIWNMVFNLAIQMLHNEDDAYDATQAIFEIVLEKIGTFRYEAKLSTWVYRISYNYLIDEVRSGKKEKISFEIFEKDVTDFKEYENELNLTREEERIYVQEIKIGCTKALLQCLEPENRYIFILGTIFSFPHKDAAEICHLSYDNYRKRLSRSRNKIKNFMSQNCGLVNPGAKCKCNKRLLIAKERGRINYEKTLYRNDRAIKNYIAEMNEIDEISRIYRDNPFLEISNEDISHKIRNFGIIQEISEKLI